MVLREEKEQEGVWKRSTRGADQFYSLVSRSVLGKSFVSAAIAIFRIRFSLLPQSGEIRYFSLLRLLTIN